MEEKLREMLVEYGKKLVQSGLVQGTWGNISVRIEIGRASCRERV